MTVICEHCSAKNPTGATYCIICGERLRPATATGALPEHTLLNGRYDLVGLLGQGAMGAVYKAFDLVEESFVAIKEMSDEALGTDLRDQAVEQFRREALLLQSLSHPQLVAVRDVFSSGRRHYMVMDFIDGRPLSDVSPLATHADEGMVRRWTLQLCDVLAYLHSRQPPIIFRDLKPENIMVGENEEHGDRIKLIDFGIARFFDPQKDSDTVAIGTSGYMAPEAFHGQTDPRSDLYSLGVTLHRLLTGLDPAQNSWALPDVRTVARQVSEEMAQIIAHATELSPENRFQSATEFKRALGGDVSGVSVLGETPVATPAAARISTDRPVWFNGRVRIVSLEQLVALCDQHWNAAVNHLRMGELETWLYHLGEKALADYARELRQITDADMNVQLETWLEATGLVDLPRLEAAPPAQQLGIIPAQSSFQARFRLRNQGRGFLVAKVETDAYWLIPDPLWITGNDATLTLHVDASRLPLNQTAEGQVFIQSNGGNVQLPVKARPIARAALHQATARPPGWAAGAMFLLAVFAGMWLSQGLIEHWGLGWNLGAWQGWVAAPLAAAILALAAMLGSMFQWERLAQDAPLKLWGKDALWTGGSSLAAVLLGAGLAHYLLPQLPGIPHTLPLARVQTWTPLVMGGVAAMSAASGWGAIKRQHASGRLSFLVLTFLAVIMPVVGAYGGLILTKLIVEVTPTLLKDDHWLGVVWGAMVLTVALGYVLARGTGLLRVQAPSSWGREMPSGIPASGQQARPKMVREPLARGYWLAGLGAVVTLVASFLPWIIVVANGQLLYRWNALALAGRSLKPLTKKQPPPETMPFWALPAISSVLLLIGLLFVWIRGRRSVFDVIAPLLLGGIALAPILVFYLKDEFVAVLAIGDQSLRFDLGFWIAFVGAVAMLLGGVINLVLTLFHTEQD